MSAEYFLKENCWLETIPTEIIVRIILMLDTYQIFVLSQVNSKIRNIIKTHVFKYSFNKPNTDLEQTYSHCIKNYFNNIWLSIVKPIQYLQDEDLLFQNMLLILELPTTQNEDANPKSNRDKLVWKNKNNKIKYKKNYFFKQSLSKLHTFIS